MRSTLCILALTVLFAATFAVSQEEGVYVLTTDSFDSWLAEQEFALIEFYAPWCGHCKNLAPEYAQAAQTLGDASSAKLAKVDATEHPELGQKFGVSGYPTLFWFSKADGYSPVAYNGPRQAAGIVSWINNQVRTTLDVLDADDLQNTINENAPDATVVLYGESTVYGALVSISKSIDGVHFYQVTKLGDHKDGEIVVYPSHTDAYTVEFTDSIESFVSALLEKAFPPVVEFSQENFKRLAGSTDFVVVVVEDLQDEAKSTAVVSLMNEVATERTNFGFMYGDSNMLARGVQGAGASGNVFPTAIAINVENNQQIAYDEEMEFTAGNFGKWLDGLLDGTTKTFQKSEPIPEDNNGPVTTLVAKNFDSIMSGKAGLVEYYAPWCGHCKSLAPVYEELGAHFKDNSNVVIAKIDATANYIAENVKGFPTLVWYDGKGGSETYNGDRDLPSLIEFVNSKIGYHKHDEF